MKPAVLLLAAFFLGCKKAPPPPLPTTFLTSGPSFHELFDPSRASTRALAPAQAGSHEAQDAFLLAAYVRLNQHSDATRDLEQMRENFSRLIWSLGDEVFAKALERQRPEVCSAAKRFLDVDGLQYNYPKSAASLRKAADIVWPAETLR